MTRELEPDNAGAGRTTLRLFVHKIMIASKESFEPHSSEQLPNAKKIYVAGKIHPDVRVPMREIEVGADEIFHRPSRNKCARARL